MATGVNYLDTHTFYERINSNLAPYCLVNKGSVYS